MNPARSLMGLGCLAACVLVALPSPATAQSGAALYAERCAPCHQAQGEGNERYPPLTHLAQWLATPEGRHYVARVVMHGFAGPIEVGGKTYDGLMLTFRWRLKDPQILAVLRYVAEDLNSAQPGYQPFDLQLLGDIRGKKMRDTEVMAMRAQLPAR